jgi:membrane protein CcdC involved in cytochrome C biogenesis
MIYQIIPILFGLSFIVFFWGLSKFILNAGNKTELEKGKSYIMWGILILFILISFRAIISFIAGELDFGDVSGIPQLKSSGSMDTNTLNGALSPKI